MHGMPGVGMGRMTVNTPATGSTWPTGLPLRRLGVLENTSPTTGEFEGTLVASRFQASLVTGRTTELWGYNSAFPGPTIELREGQRVTINFANRLGLDSTIHWHGLPVPYDQDGSPMDPVASGAERRYSFDVPLGAAGTYWYHPHAHQTNSQQVGHGLAPPLIVRSAADPLGSIPEVTLLITSLALDQNGQVITEPATMSGMEMTMMTGSSELLVNGQKRPTHMMTPGTTERWRIINVTADRYLRLGIDGHRFAVVGTDGGFLSEPLSGLSEWLLSPAQRVEIVVTISAGQSARYTLQDLGFADGMGSRAGSALMTIETSEGSALAPIELPAVLRPIADLGPATDRQSVVLSSSGMGGTFLINGRTFDMNRIDLETVVGRVELWDIVNTSFMDHPIHIHGTQFQLVGRTVRGLFTPATYPAWFDTVNVPAGETIIIKTRQNLPSKRMVHCHLLPHEDAGMMAVLDVKPA